MEMVVVETAAAASDSEVAVAMAQVATLVLEAEVMDQVDLDSAVEVRSQRLAKKGAAAPATSHAACQLAAPCLKAARRSQK